MFLMWVRRTLRSVLPGTILSTLRKRGHDRRSIVDKVTLLSLGVDLPVCPSRVHGVAESVVRTLGKARLMVHMGKKYGVSHKFSILDTNEPTVILGRDFLSLFRSTEFDWSNYRIRLGEHWIPTEASLHGGEILSRMTHQNNSNL